MMIPADKIRMEGGSDKGIAVEGDAAAHLFHCGPNHVVDYVTLRVPRQDAQQEL